MLMCQPNFTIDVARCFVLPANRSLVSILHNKGLRHSTHSYSSVACDVIAAMLETLTKDLSLASFVYVTNMAAMSLSLYSLGNEYNSRIISFMRSSQPKLSFKSLDRSSCKEHLTLARCRSL
jgi:hypothetical protein